MEIQIDGKRYGWPELSSPEVRRALLPAIERMIADAKRDPEAFARTHGFRPTSDDIQAAIIYSTGQLDDFTEDEVRGALGLAPEGENMDAKQIEELNKLYDSPEYKRASRLDVTDRAKLMSDPGYVAERRAWLRAEQLERAFHADEPKREDRDYQGNPKSPGGIMKGTDKFIFAEVFAISKLPAHEQVHASRALRAQWRNDPKSAFNDQAHPNHQSAVEAMQMLYNSERFEDGSPVITEE